MSLISDALRKAQAQKSQSSTAPGDSPFSPEAAPVPAPAGRKPRGKSRTIVLLGAAVLAACGFIAWRTVFHSAGGPPANASAEVRSPAALVQSTTLQQTAPRPPSPNAVQPATKPAGADQWITTSPNAEAIEIIQKGLNAGNCDAPPDMSAGEPESVTDQSGYMSAWDRAVAAMFGESAAGGTASTQPAPAAEQKPAPATQPVEPAPPSFDPSKYKISGVLVGDDGGTAVVNGRLLRSGDTLDGAKVTRITSRGIYIHAGDANFIITP